MIVWVWDARGPVRSAAGVADDEKRARKLAAASLLSTGASEVLVEQASAELGIRTLSYGYARTGHGWRGHRTSGGRVAWRRFTAADTVRERTAAGAPDGSVTPCPMTRWLKAGSVLDAPLDTILRERMAAAAAGIPQPSVACKPDCVPDSWCKPLCSPGACKPRI